MAGIKCVINTFFTFGKTTDAFILTQSMKVVAASCDQFVSIDLMTNIPDELVIRGIKDIMQGQGQLHNAEAGSKMPPGFGDCFYDFLSDFLGKNGQVSFL